MGSADFPRTYIFIKQLPYDFGSIKARISQKKIVVKHSESLSESFRVARLNRHVGQAQVYYQFHAT